nr:unnamed protein product [Naegleria fowleri]
MGANNSVERETKKRLCKAAKEGDLEVLQQILSDPMGSTLVNSFGPNGTPLYEAACWNQVEAAKLLLKHGANVNAQDQNNGWTALHLACKKNSVEMVKLLVENKAELNITTRDELKQTPLHLAAHLSSLEIVKCLLDNGANKSLTDRFGSTPEKWTKNPEIKSFILNHHINDKSSDSMSSTDSKKQILNNKYSIEERIGKGGFGVVYKCSMIIPGSEPAPRAIKVVTFEDELEIENANREAAAMLQLDNPNVLKTYEIFKYEHDDSSKGLCFCMEYYAYGDLDSYIRKQKDPIPPEIVISVFYQMSKALAYLHERKLIHRDLKPQNIFIKNLDGKVINVVLGDFGLSKTIENTQNQTKAGTWLFMTDVWSLGVVMYQIMSKDLETNVCALLLTKGSSAIETIKQNISRNGLYPNKVVELVLQTLSVDHEQRPTAADLCTSLASIKE